MAWLDLAGMLGSGGDPPDNNKLALIDMGDVWTDGLPVSSNGLGKDDKQQLLWEYPGILWRAVGCVDVYIPIFRPRRRS